MATAEDLSVIDAEFTAEEEEALDAETSITPYERLDVWQGILSDPAKAIAAFGGIAIDALAIQFDDGRGKQHFALTAEGAKAVLAKAGRPMRIHKPEFEEFTVDGQPWVRCIATITMLDDGSEVRDISERPRMDRYGKPDKFAGRAAFTSALARVARTICAGTIGMLEGFFTQCMAEGKVIVPGEAPDAIRTESNRAQAGLADERLRETPRIGKDKARELTERMNSLYRRDKGLFANLGREMEALKKRLCGAALKLEKLPAEHLDAVEEWLAAKEREAMDAAARTEEPAPKVAEETPQLETAVEDPFPSDPEPESPLAHIPTEQDVRALIGATSKELVAKAYELAGLKPGKPYDNPAACQKLWDALHQVRQPEVLVNA